MRIHKNQRLNNQLKMFAAQYFSTNEQNIKIQKATHHT